MVGAPIRCRPQNQPAISALATDKQQRPRRPPLEPQKHGLACEMADPPPALTASAFIPNKVRKHLGGLKTVLIRDCFPRRVFRDAGGLGGTEKLESEGQVLDISPVACQAFVEVPLAITPKLWRAIAPDDRFRLEDPRLLCLCFAMLLTILTHTSTREEFEPFCHTVWFEAVVLGRRVSLKLMTHPGDDRAPVMTLLTEEEAGLTEI